MSKKTDKNKVIKKLKADNVKLHNDNAEMLQIIKSLENMNKILQDQIVEWGEEKDGKKSKIITPKSDIIIPK